MLDSYSFQNNFVSFNEMAPAMSCFRELAVESGHGNLSFCAHKTSLT